MQRQHSTRGSSHKGRGRGGSASGGGRPVKKDILDLSKYMDKQVRVVFSGGRQVHGFLKGFDPLLNLVLDDTVELLRDENNNLTASSRPLGLVVARTTTIILISPVDGMEEISNPYISQ